MPYSTKSLKKPRKIQKSALKLDQLNDYVLIFKYLDHDEKMELMLTCKRFEYLIGNNRIFYKDFQLTFKRNLSDFAYRYHLKRDSLEEDEHYDRLGSKKNL
jgi:hypothetical protein